MSRILCEVPPCTPDLCAAMWAGQGDPLYAIGSSWSQRSEYASDLGLPYSTWEGEGFYIELSADEISALQRAARDFRASIDQGWARGVEPSEEEERIEDDCAFFLGLQRDDGRGWPGDFTAHEEGEEPHPALVAHPEHGLILAGERARSILSSKET